MASTLRKIADKLEGKDKEPNNPQSSNFGPHSSAATNKLDPTIDSDRDGRNDPTSRVGGYGNTQTAHSHTTAGGIGGPTHHGAGVGHTQPTNTGPHDSNIANKLDPRVDSTQTQYGTQTTTHSSGINPVAGNHPHSTTATTGPHNSNIANKLDPRVDADQAQYGGGYGTHPTTHSSGVHPTTGNHPHSTTTAGPHNSDLVNKLDPRVDSDRDGRANPTSHTGGYGSTHTETGGYAGTNTSTTTTGPHSNDLLNKLDPRVDSDAHGRNNPATHTGGYGHTQNTTHVGSGTHGTHVGGTHTTTGAQGYTGTNVAHDDPRSTNAGPHSSNLLNKLDPRVDSDRDGRNDPTSRAGGYGQTQTGTGGVGRY